MLQVSYIGCVCLFILIFQNLLYIYGVRYAQSRDAPKFIPSSVVIMSEFIKLFTCLSVLKIKKELKTSLEAMYNAPKDVLISFVPALMYVFQNRLLISAISNLDPVTFQILYQLKLLTTALFSALLLRKQFSIIQWLSLALLFFGVSIVEMPSNFKSTNIQSNSTSFGILCVLVASILSGLACVYFEMVLKSSQKSLWSRNVELAFASIVTGLPAQCLFDWSEIGTKSYFHGFDWVVWIVVGLHSFGGILVALVVKYANNILKNFACSISIILSCLVSVAFFDMHLTVNFVVGTTLVLVSTVLYTIYPLPSNKTQTKLQ